MRKYSAAVQQLIDSGNISIFYLVSIKNNKYDLKHTNLPFDVTVPGWGGFSANNHLSAVEPPRQSSVVDREAYKISYNDNDFEWSLVFSNGITGAKVKIMIGFMNNTDSILNGTAPGMPMLNAEDFIVGYQGFVDNVAHTASPDGQVSAVIECSSPMADLGLVKPFITSSQQLSRYDATDTAFDEVFTGSGNVELAWGKKKSTSSSSRINSSSYSSMLTNISGSF